MERPTIIIEGAKYVMLPLTGKDWRIFGEFANKAPNITEEDFIEKHADFIAKFFRLTKEDLLEKMPLEDFVPTTLAIRNFIYESIGTKIKAIEKNLEADKAQ